MSQRFTFKYRSFKKTQVRKIISARKGRICQINGAGSFVNLQHKRLTPSNKNRKEQVKRNYEVIHN
jgi:hypothetical protein